MRTVFGIGVVLLALGIAGYAAGIVTAYPGRAFSVTAVMVGTALVAMGYPSIGRPG